MFDEASWDYSSAPLEPRFSKADTSECRKEVNEAFERATTLFEMQEKNNAKLNKSYEAILARQNKYGVNLGNNNKEFEAWTISDWEQSP